MPANSTVFPWPPYYGHFKFFEERMRQHRCVSKVVAQGGGVYELILSKGGTLRVFVCECYSYGAAEYAETIERLGTFDAIVINSSWCGYTVQAKRICRAGQVGLFKIADFMAALNKPEIWSHLNEVEEERFQERRMAVSETVWLYGFGSYFGACPSDAGDLDLLLQHRDTAAASIQYVLWCKALLTGLLPKAHITILSEDEERELRFKDRCGAVLIGVLTEGAERDAVRAIVERIGIGQLPAQRF